VYKTSDPNREKGELQEFTQPQLKFISHSRFSPKQNQLHFLEKESPTFLEWQGGSIKNNVISMTPQALGNNDKNLSENVWIKVQSSIKDHSLKLQREIPLDP
jgi:hypothetical protein